MSLFLKNNSIELGSLSGFASDLHEEFEPERILVFFMTFSLRLMFVADGRLLGDFNEYELESGLLSASFGIVGGNSVFSGVCVVILL